MNFVRHGCVLAAALGLVVACSDTKTDDTPGNTSSGGSGDPDSGAGGAAGVACTHPGAGKAIAGTDRCECTTNRKVAGEWTTFRTCREGDACSTRDREESVTLTQNGTNITAERGPAFAFTGTLCGDVLIWSGGPKDGLNPECGTIRFSDDNRYTTDSCYVGSGECARTHSEGCKDQKGQCTGTGAKKPETAAPIQKLICTK